MSLFEVLSRCMVWKVKVIVRSSRTSKQKEWICIESFYHCA